MRKEKGITLIALIVTIIILLILAGITIATLTGNNGLLNRSKSSRNKYEQEKAKEQLLLVLTEAKVIRESDELTDEMLDEKLNEKGQVDSEDNTKVIVNGYVYKIDRDELEIVEYLGEDGEKVEGETDNVEPTVDSLTVVIEEENLKISATGTDHESGLKQFNYTISPTDGIPEDKISGTFAPEQTIVIPCEIGIEYTVSVVAEDNAGNVTQTPKTETVVKNTMSLAEVKAKVNATTLKQYQGIEVEYNPPGGGAWRVFYCDKTGTEFGDGAGAIYLKRDFDDNLVKALPTTDATSRGLTYMRKMNPQWRDSESGKLADLASEKAASYLYDPDNWINYKTEGAQYAIGTSSLEMYVKAYNAHYGNDSLMCKMGENGYLVGVNGTDFGTSIAAGTIKNGRNEFLFSKSGYYWLGSPSNQGINYLYVWAGSGSTLGSAYFSATYRCCPIVCIPRDQISVLVSFLL